MRLYCDFIHVVWFYVVEDYTTELPNKNNQNEVILKNPLIRKKVNIQKILQANYYYY